MHTRIVVDDRETRCGLHILQGLPEIGAERASSLLDKFGSIEAVLTASAEELTMIKGIGAHTAKSIDWVIREADSEYGSAFFDADPGTTKDRIC